MDRDRTRVAVIFSANHDGAAGESIADWVLSRAHRRDGLELDTIDLAEARLPEAPTESAEPLPRAVCDLAPWLAAADAFIVLTPELNGSFPAALKNAIDWYREEWRAKPVAFISHGGPSGGALAVDQLRLVFAALAAVTTPAAVGLVIGRDLGADGSLTAPEHHDPALFALLDELTWWAGALRTARARSRTPGPTRSAHTRRT